jgi:protein-S-isoprenylcysteine O-methyltransferase Ste14
LLNSLLLGGIMVLAWSGWRGFFFHPARSVTLAVLAVYTAVAYQVTAGLSRGIRHAAESPWFHAGLQVVGLLMAVLPPLLESRGIWVLPGGDGLRYAGVAVLVLGTVFRLGPMLALGGRFSHFVALQNEHTLEAGGFYAHVRHPSYLGLLLQLVGVAAVFRSIAGMALVLLLLGLLLRRMDVEERFMAEQFGDSYRSYMARTKRLLPGVY